MLHFPDLPAGIGPNPAFDPNRCFKWVEKKHQTENWSGWSLLVTHKYIYIIVIYNVYTTVYTYCI